MKHLVPVLAALLVAACNATPDATPAPAAAPKAATAVKRGATSGVVQSIDPVAKTITIAHGPVEALGWPGMTMTFRAPDTDLSTFEAGDAVAFEFDSTGTDGTIVAIAKQ